MALCLESINIQHLTSAITEQQPFVMEDVNGLLASRGLPSLAPTYDRLVVATSSWGNVLGAAQSYDTEEGVWVDRIATAHQLEGRGLGAALLFETCIQAVDDPGAVLQLSPSYDAVGFYRHLGFVRSKQYPEEEDMPDVWFSPVAALMEVIAERVERYQGTNN